MRIPTRHWPPGAQQPRRARRAVSTFSEIVKEQRGVGFQPARLHYPAPLQFRDDLRFYFFAISRIEESRLDFLFFCKMILMIGTATTNPRHSRRVPPPVHGGIEGGLPRTSNVIICNSKSVGSRALPSLSFRLGKTFHQRHGKPPATRRHKRRKQH